MSKCPVCKKEHSATETSCSNCGFDQLNREFINKEELMLWMEKTVLPCRRVYEFMHAKIIALGDHADSLAQGKTFVHHQAVAASPGRVSEVKETSQTIPPTDPSCFEYAYETGTECSNTGKGGKIDWLTPYIKRGLRITAYTGFDEGRIVVPAEIDGHPVVCIGENAFKNVSASEICLPQSIVAILTNAFDSCRNLKEMKLPDNLAYLGDYCFSNSGIASIVFPDSLNYVSVGCCLGCQNLTNVVLSAKTKTIYDSAFLNCSRLRNIVLPQTLKEICKHSFSGTSLSVLVVPSSVSTVNKECFYWKYTRSNTQVICVFQGSETTIPVSDYDHIFGISMIYCLPGSNIQRIAREHSIPIRPLSAFNMGDY